MDEKRNFQSKKREPLHAKESLCWQENEEYYLNRFPKKAKTEGMYYYFQKVDGVTVKTEVTKEQWTALYAFNKKALRHDLKFYDDRYFTRFPVYEDEDGEEDDPMEHQADEKSLTCERDNCENIDSNNLYSRLTKSGKKLYDLYYKYDCTQEEIAKQLKLKQYQVSRLLQQLTEAFDKQLLDDGSRDEIDIQVDCLYNRYRKTGKLEHNENVVMTDFLSCLLPQEEDRLRCWFYTQSELYRYGIKFLIRYRLEDFSERNVYREMFALKDLTIRGYFMAYMTDLPIEYQWLYLHLQGEIERRAERFTKPKDYRHKEFIKELVKVAKKANMKPMEYFKTKFMPYLEEQNKKQLIDYAKKELCVCFADENETTPISEQIERITYFYGHYSHSKGFCLADLSLCSLTSANEITFSDMAEKPIALFLQIPDEKETRHTLAAMVLLQAYKELVAKANTYRELFYNCNDSFYDMSTDYFGKWFSGYVYIKNLSGKTVVFTDADKQKIALEPDTLAAFNFGKFYASDAEDFEKREFIEQLGILKNGLGWDMEENYANLWNACADYDNNHRGSYLTDRIQEYDFVDDEVLDYILVEQSKNGLSSLRCFIGDTYNAGLYRLDGYGNLANVDNSDFEYLIDDIVQTREEDITPPFYKEPACL